MIDLRQLHIFVVAAEILNFSKTGERLHMSQPAVTQHIHALELIVGTPLFMRKGNVLKLTEAGQNLYPIARDIVEKSLRAEEQIGSIDDQISGYLRIGCSTTPGKYKLPEFLAEFLKMYPRVKASCTMTSRTMALKLLEKGSIDFAFSSSYLEFDHNIDYSICITEPVILIAPVAHPWAISREISFEQLFTEEFIMREDTSGTYRAVQAIFAHQGRSISELKIKLTFGNSEAVFVSVANNSGVGFVTQSILDNFGGNKVIPVKITNVEILQDIYLCRHRLNTLGKVQYLFWQFIKAKTNSQSQAFFPGKG